VREDPDMPIDQHDEDDKPKADELGRARRFQT
jgi:hypothetical protein